MKIRYIVYGVTILIGLIGVLFLSRDIGFGLGSNGTTAWVYILFPGLLLLLEFLLFTYKDWLLKQLMHNGRESESKTNKALLSLHLFWSALAIVTILSSQGIGLMFLPIYLAIIAILWAASYYWVTHRLH